MGSTPLRSGDIMDQYTTLPWQTLCEEVTRLRIRLLGGQLVRLPIAGVSA